MQPEDPPISLNLNAPPVPAASGAAVPVEQLQFHHAEPIGGQTASRRCVACKSPIYTTYFQVLGKDVCPNCTQRIQAGTQAPAAHSLLKAALYGGGAALAGCILYASVAIVAHLQIALLAIVIGFMVGKAVRHGSGGLGGRPQQILAVLLTYFAITFSYVAVAIYHMQENRTAASHQTTPMQTTPMQVTPHPSQPSTVAVLGAAIVMLAGVAAVAPFLALASPNPVGAIISLVIIYFGLRRAWSMTGRPDLQIFGPYNATEAGS